ncbi:hypothetical protein ACFV0L_07250 [Streptosporangium canum]|uniref:hypothetical protein n=1 Tax=Streptosporangium canum TaxID=324952 RepID=UPI003678BED4
MTEVISQTPEDEVPGIALIELEARAKRLKQMTFGQYKAIRQDVIDLGTPPEVASTLPWLAADPQAMVSALRAAGSREEIIVRGVLGRAIEADVFTALILRSLENMRAEEHRYRGTFNLPRYTSLEDNTALRADLSAHPSAAAVTAYISEQLQVVDGYIDRRSPYGEDIRRNGIRRGGVLFPVVIDLPGKQRIGGFDSTDCYSRTLFAQQHSGITVPHVLNWWLEYPPTTPKEFKDHPLKAMRDKLVAVAEKISAGKSVSEEESQAVLRAVMPKTMLVLAVRDTEGLGIDEVRRRLVSERHLDKQLEFTTDTKNETRAEAVIAEVARRELLPEHPTIAQQDLLELLENPRPLVDAGNFHGDDVAVMAAAVFLPTPRSPIDRLIFPAIASRGVIAPDDRRKGLRSELAAQVIMRVVDAGIGDRELRKSALERALRNPRLRGVVFEDRPVPELLSAALAEFEEFERAKRRGDPPVWGLAMRQIALRGAFYLFFGRNLGLDRSPVGGKVGGDNREPTQIIERLGTTTAGLHQLAQAIFDGRKGLTVRLLDADAPMAQDLDTKPAEDDVLTDTKLRVWLIGAVAKADKDRRGEDNSARARVGRDALRARTLTEELEDTVSQIGTHADTVDADKKGRPYVALNGLRDPNKLRHRLSKLSKQLSNWHTAHEVLNGNMDFGDGDEE